LPRRQVLPGRYFILCTLYRYSLGGTRSRLHFDAGDFFLVQLDGHKRVTLVDPAFSLALYADFSFAYGHSPVEPIAVNTSLFPEAASVPAIEALLSPGDVLYLPARWWHFVDSLPGRNLAFTLQMEELMSGFPGLDSAQGRIRRSLYSYSTIQRLALLREIGRRNSKALPTLCPSLCGDGGYCPAPDAAPLEEASGEGTLAEILQAVTRFPNPSYFGRFCEKLEAPLL